MKPKTKLEKRVTELASTLPALTDAQEQWMLKQVPVDATSWHEYEYTIMQVCQEFQVFRVFQILVSTPENKSGYASKGSEFKTIDNIGECYQWWVDDKGRKTLLAYNLFGYHNQCHAIYKWTRRTQRYEYDHENKTYRVLPLENLGMEIHHPKNSDYHYYYYGPYEYRTTDHKMLCPIGAEYHPTFVRNNGGTEFKDDGKDWVSYMMNPITERLYKMNSELFMFYRDEVPYKWRNKYFAALRLVHRKKYEPFFDSRKQRLWKDMVDAAIILGLDVHSPHYVCPDNLMEMHDSLIKRLAKHEMAKRNEAERNKMIEEFVRKEKEAMEYEKKIEPFNDIDITDGRMHMFVCPSILDMMEEGEAMHNCVYRMSYYSKKESLILFCRDVKTEERMTTIELKLSSMTIAQCYAACNKIHLKDKEIRKLLEDNLWQFEMAMNNKPAAVAA